jgi:hypothetical protein
MANHTILCVHGIGSVESDPNWDQPWITAITNGFGAPGSGNNLQFAKLAYDQIFDQFPVGAPEYVEAITELIASAAWHAVTDPFGARAFGLPTWVSTQAAGTREWLLNGLASPTCVRLAVRL